MITISYTYIYIYIYIHHLDPLKLVPERLKVTITGGKKALGTYDTCVLPGLC